MVSTPHRGQAVLVTGGSGFVGQNLVKSLSLQGKSIVSMYRHRLAEASSNVYPVCSDMSSAELLAAPLRNVATVVHLAWEGGISGSLGTGPSGRYSLDPGQPQKLPPNIQNLRNLLAAMEKAGTQRIVFLSAKGASRYTQLPFLMEKYLAEFFILNSRVPEKIIVRSAPIFDSDVPKDRLVRSVARVMSYPVYPVPMARKEISPVHVDDLVRALSVACLVEMEDEKNVVFDFSGGEAIKMEDLFAFISSEYLGGKRIALKGFLGNSLLPLFDRENARRPRVATQPRGLRVTPGVAPPAKYSSGIPHIKDLLAFAEDSGLPAASELTSFETSFMQNFPTQRLSLKKTVSDHRRKVKDENEKTGPAPKEGEKPASSPSP